MELSFASLRLNVFQVHRKKRKSI